MKKTILKFGLFLLAVLLPTGCSSDEEDETRGTIIEQIDCGYETSTFFNEQVPFLGGKCPYLYDNKAHVTRDYLIINNEDDYINTFSEYEGILPEIDFSKYSLVIGSLLCQQPQKKGEKIPTEPKQQFLYKTNDGYAMELHYSYEKVGSDDVITQIIQYVNFWGIYPKLEDKEIKMYLKFV